jgi:thiamine pyrophosphate-dependent acetolactate synthase large subunit-like protein
MPAGGGAVPLGRPEYGSDALAGFLRDLDFEYVALNPGASYRGLHDSIVNHLGNVGPTMVLCLHEEHAVAIAHGYAKVTGRPMLAALHTNVGLMHASMAIFNAWCDRVPVVVLGSNGPADAARRRPWIEWLHTTSDQAAPVRQFVKWDDEPRSVAAAAESLVRATALARQVPAGPTYVAFDAGMQEEPLDGQVLPEVRALEVHDPLPDPAALEALATRLGAARRPVLLFGRLRADEPAWDARVELAERFGARVITDLRAGATFPTHHPLHVGPPGLAMNGPAREALRTADLVVGFGAVDLAGSLRQGGTPEVPDREVVAVTADPYVHNGWSKDHQGLPAGARYLLGDPDKAVSWLLDRAPRTTPAAAAASGAPAPGSDDGAARPPAPGERLPIRAVARVVHDVLGDGRTTFVRLPIGWPGEAVRFEHPLDFLGGDGGAGVGSGPGLAVGVALGLKNSDRLAVAVLGDGDFLMGCTALWTAAAQRLGLLVVVSNNRSYFNDELHQERVALERGRPVENRWIGQRIDDPPVDLLAIARAQGARTYGPVDDLDLLGPTLREAADRARAGEVVVVDVAVRAEYDAGATSTIAP